MARRRLHLFGPWLLLAAVLVYYAGYVKDDAYISFRYAAHWARGEGLVFNPGEHAEGFTNFLWTAAVAGLLRVGLPALLSAKLLGAAMAFCGLLWVRRLADGDARAAWLWAASPTVGLWAASGMEATAMAAACAGAWLLVRNAHGWRRALAAGLALAACAMLRPEGHVLVALAALAAPRTLPFALAVLGPYHFVRIRTFGALLPLPFLVKASAPSIFPGLIYALLFLLFFGHGVLLALAARHRDRLAAAACGVFVAYLVYVGGDEMRWFRLYAPALGLLMALAAPRLPWRLVPAFVLFGLLAHATDGWHLRSYLAQDERAYFPLADTIVARARPGDTALFQDAGATPFRALEVPFSDPIGLTDARVARLYASAHRSPYHGAGPPAFEAQLRDELLARNPRFIALVAYVPRALERDVRERVDADPEPTLRPFLRTNSYSHGIPDDERFRAAWRFRACFRRNDGYYLALYERPLLRSQADGAQDPGGGR
jgi:hypothetical protein